MNIDVSSLYSPRMLVFLETDPQTNEYHQVLLTKQQYKKVSQHICELITPADLEYIDREITELQGSLLNVAENEQDPIALLEYAEGYLKNPSIFWKKRRNILEIRLKIGILAIFRSNL